MPRPRIARRSRALKAAAVACRRRALPPSLAIDVAGLRFPSPVGLAAGFDKDAEVPDAMLGAGVRLRRGRDGYAAAAGGQSEAAPVPARRGPGGDQPHGLQQCRPGGGASSGCTKRDRHGIVGVNIGANKDSADRIADYAAGVRAMAPVADYLTVNISSPNTPGLRDLQAGGELVELLAAVREARVPGGPPVFLKVAPDLERGDHERIVRAAIDQRDRRADRRQHDRVAPAAQVAPRPRSRRAFRRAAEGAGARALRAVPRGERRRDPADRGGRDRQCRRRLGADRAPARAWSSSIRRWSIEGPGIARRIADGLAERLDATRDVEHCRGGGKRLARRQCAAVSGPCSQPSSLGACATSQSPAMAASYARRRQCGRSARRRGGRGDASPRRQRNRCRACDLARAQRGRTAKLGHWRRRLPGHTATRAARSLPIDGREEAPMAASSDMVLMDGRPLAIGEAIPGGQERRRSRQYPHDGAGPSPSMASCRGRPCSSPRSRSRATGFLSPRGCEGRWRIMRDHRRPDAPRRGACIISADGRAAGRHAHPQPAPRRASCSSWPSAGPTASTSAPTRRRSSPRSAMRRAIRRR